MASASDWRASLSASGRYDNIESIKTAIETLDPSIATSQKDAFLFENEAYKNSKSLDEYNAACHMLPGRTTGASSEEQPVVAEDHAPSSPGIQIGPYLGCHLIADGVTSDVYRSRGRALKVITETRNMEPHSPTREIKILSSLREPCIPLIESFRDQEQRLVLVFQYMPLSLEALLAQAPLRMAQVRGLFTDLFHALEHIHGQGIIHRDIKPSAVLLKSADGPAYLSDFGTAWHPELSIFTEPTDDKVLDIGTGPYRAPEVLFGNKSYGTPVDMWGAGVMLAECCRPSRKPIFESRPVHEDGNQLGLILSIFKTIGSPTPEAWPEAKQFRTPPFDMYQSFERKTWEEILPDVEPKFRELIAALVKYNSSRATASQTLQFPCMRS